MEGRLPRRGSPFGTPLRPISTAPPAAAASAAPPATTGLLALSLAVERTRPAPLAVFLARGPEALPFLDVWERLCARDFVPARRPLLLVRERPDRELLEPDDLARADFAWAIRGLLSSG